MALHPKTDRGELDLGRCCCCEITGPTVRNLIMIARRAPERGTGWGCVVCGLSSDGAIAVKCDACLESNAPLRFVICGHATEKRRLPIKELSAVHFDHVLSLHEKDD